MKKILSTVLLITMLIALVPSVFAATSYTWEQINTSSGVYVTYDGRSMPWKPADKYVSMQNPPDFTWPYVNGATGYELKICSDSALSDVKYEKTGLTNNYYNFNTAFETGVDYYWSVRYIKSGTYSDWSAARRFRIDPDASVFTVPAVSELLNKVPVSHPRVFTTAENLESFRSIKDSNSTSQTIYNTFVNNASAYAASGIIPSEPVLNEEYWDSEKNTYREGQYENYLKDLKRCKSLSGEMLSKMLTGGFAYLLIGDETIGNYAKNLLLALADWNIEGPTSYTFDDQVHREVVYKSAMVYDWVYDRFTDDTEKTKVLNMIKNRITHTYSNGACMANLMTSLKKSPYDSHGWTTIGYLGITSYALMGDLDEAEGWLETILPLYSAVMHPWSAEDGGWSQGTDYWRYSTESSKEFIDVMALGGIINLHSKTWAKNEPLWVMYAYPKGSYGSFGDGANRVKSESAQYARNSMGKLQYFNNDTLARRLSTEQGTLGTDMYNYYAAQTIGGETESLEKYPLSHAFTDIGWAVMTNDLEDPNRVQLTFKSSPYGSFNHSHADQNSFIIQAFGENLAIKSGYYDYYHSPHDKAITRSTFAHNSVTVDGGLGQQDDRFNAKGSMTQFVNGLEFDSVTGEAQDAYNTSNYSAYQYGGDLDKFDRNIIYIRPDVFIVIDDLDAAGENQSSFEWWLNAEHAMEVDNSSALISEGNARLKANITYPTETTATYYDTFVNPVDNTVYTPTSGYEDKNVQTRVSFATESLEKTKMVVSMSVYENGGEAKTPETEYYTDYIKMTYADGTVVLVSLLDSNETVIAGDVEFKGAAVTYTESSVMLTNGSYLKMNDKVLINADRNITASMGLGQLCLSGDDDFNVTVDTMNDFLTVTDIAALKDEKGRSLSSATGISAVHNTNTETDALNISAQKGNYTIINGEGGIVSPGQLKAENVSVQKSGDGKAAVFWDAKSGRSYDVKIDDTIYENVSKSPFDFEVSEKVYSIAVREKLGKIKGSWSEPQYVSGSVRESHDKITFTEITEGEKTYIKAETIGFPSYGFFDMYLGKYDGSGKLIEVAKGEAAGSKYSARTEKPTEGKVKAFLFGKDISPLAPTAEYGNDDCTDLLGIYADGELIEGFDNGKNEYELIFKENQLVFPFVSAEPADNTSTVSVNYDFENLKAEITVKSPKGTERKINIKYKNNMSNIHFVTGAIDEMTDFVADSGSNPDSEGKQGLMSKNNVGTLTYKLDGVSKSQQYKLYTYMRGNSGGNEFGSRLFSDRATNSGNHMELVNTIDSLKGFDYFVFSHDNFYYNLGSSEITDKYFSFNISDNAEIVILSCTEQNSFTGQGFDYYTVSMQGRYMNIPGPEDKLYNIDIMGRDASGISSSYYLENYDIMKLWADVIPIDKYVVYSDEAKTTIDKNATYEAYKAALKAGEISKDSFTVKGDATGLIHKSGFLYKHKYTKVFNADKNKASTEVTISLDDLTKNTDRIIIVVKPITPKAF